MGACVSSHDHEHHHKRQQQHAAGRPSSGSARRLGKGAAPYDSVASVLAHEQQQQPGIEDSGHGNGTSPTQGSSNKRRPAPRPPKFDLATGELIPDFGVTGVFDVLHELGSGGSGQTYLCRDMASGKVVAVKFVPRPLSKEAIPFMMGEVEIQAKLGEGSLNIISLHEIILTRTHLALVMEYASGGCLTSQVSCLWESALSRGGLFMAEQESSFYLRQFVAAMAYCHRNRVAHRDLKLDNTLLEEQLVGPPRLKLCDFGFAKQWTGDSSVMHTAIGTPVYMSPQMLAARQCASGYSGVKADIWAAGILLFVMLLGTFPFDHDPKHDPNSGEAAGEVWLKQQQGSWRKHPRAAEVLGRGVLSPECCDLLDRLLTMNEERRIGTEELVSHPWLSLELDPEQQAAWDSLQAEQQQITQHLAHARDPHLAKLRKEAMLAMMAFAAKAPSSALFPGPNGAYSAAPSNAAAAASNGAVSHGLALVGSSSSATPSLEIAGVSSTLQEATASSLPGSPAVASPVGSLGTVGSTAAAAASPAGSAETMSHQQQQQQQQPSVLSSIDDTASSPDAAAAAAAAAAASPTPAPGLHSAAAAAAPDAAADEAGEGVDSFVVCDGDVLNPPAFDFARHFSFQTGEGLRSGSLEEKVDRYRQQASELRNARLAAMIAQQQQQGGGGSAAAAAAAAGAASGRRSTDSVGSSGSAADQAASPAAADGPAAADALSPRDTAHKQQQQQRGLMGALKRKDAAAVGAAGVPTAAKHSTGTSSGSSSVPAAEPQQQQQQHRKKKRFIKSPFAGSSNNKAAAAAISGGGGAAAADAAGGDDGGAEAADEVWRLPLSSTSDPAVFKLRPELAVAAGALVRQLQGSGKVPGRGRTNRSSCPT